ncbi:MAG: 4-alpha-glucanotransferase [Treponema sp.]|nr:4-alpha-glucanotransferase [Treponema sp.]
MPLPRAAGVLLAVSSLPSPYGIGSFGEAARDWLRFLERAGQKYWQILPLGPTGWGDSPYQSFSAFALSPYYIDLEALAAGGLLSPDELGGAGRADRVDYAALYRRREPLLRRAFARFSGGAAFDEFRAGQEHWLPDYGLFMAIKKKQKGRSWLEWDEKFRFRDEAALGRFREKYAGEIDFYSFVQYLARSQWLSLKAYANSLGVSIIGDMPIYVAMDSADTWAKSGLFLLDENRRPLRVAGCPPDPFSASGQLWGNPLYRWELHAETGFAWWLSRLALSRELYDILRIDHFRGFESYFSIDAAAADARGGEWVKGPGMAFVEAVKRGLPGMNIIAEDLGYLTAEVRALLRASGFPGMKVLQFAFDSREAGDYMPYTYGRGCVVYTGTHDNSTALGWFGSASPADIALAMDFFGIKNCRDGNWAFIRAALASVADTAIIPMQDYLGLDDRARMNTPATLGGGNWLWRMKPGAADSALAAKMRRLAQVYGRLD